MEVAECHMHINGDNIICYEQRVSATSEIRL